MIKRMLPKGEFARNALTLMTGTTIAQAIPIAISPILTRLFTPADFGVYALFSAMAGFLAAAATGRYEVAVVLPDTEEEADALVLLSMAIAFSIGLVLLLGVTLFHGPLMAWINHPEVDFWIYLAPLSVAITGCYNALNYWLNRRKNYSQMSANRVLQSGISGGVQLASGAAHLGPGGLILGPIVSQLVTTAQLALRFWHAARHVPLQQAALRMVEMAKRYSHHPLHLLPAQWLGSGALQIPVLAIATLYGPMITGFFSLANRMMVLPSLLVANALGDVYRQQVSLAYRERGEFRALFLRTLIYTAALAFPPLAVLFIVAPDLFALVFGEPWRIAGSYARILVISAFFQFVFTPLDKGALVVGATGYIAIWHIARFLAFSMAAIASFAFKFPVEIFLLIYVTVSSMAYILDGWVGFNFSKLKDGPSVR